MISVIIPVYNVAEYIGKCIESVVKQTYSNIEIILVDDGSSDSSGCICDEYVKKDNRIRVYHKKNEGVSSARNLGIEVSNGDLIAFIDSDDYVGDNYLRNLYDDLMNSDADLVVGGEIICIENRFKSFGFEKETIDNQHYSRLFAVHKLHKHCSPWGKIFKKKIIQSNFLRFDTDVHLGEDIIFVFQYLVHCKSVMISNSSEYYYLQRDGSLTKRLNSFNSEREGLKAFEKASDMLISKFMLDTDAIKELRQWSVIFYDRMKLSVLKYKKMSTQLKLLADFDWTRLKEYKNYTSWKERLLDSMLWTNNINLFILLHKLIDKK